MANEPITIPASGHAVVTKTVIIDGLARPGVSTCPDECDCDDACCWDGNPWLLKIGSDDPEDANTGKGGDFRDLLRELSQLQHWISGSGTEEDPYICEGLESPGTLLAVREESAADSEDFADTQRLFDGEVLFVREGIGCPNRLTSPTLLECTSGASCTDRFYVVETPLSEAINNTGGLYAGQVATLRGLSLCLWTECSADEGGTLKIHVDVLVDQDSCVIPVDDENVPFNGLETAYFPWLVSDEIPVAGLTLADLQNVPLVPVERGEGDDSSLPWVATPAFVSLLAIRCDDANCGSCPEVPGLPPLKLAVDPIPPKNISFNYIGGCVKFVEAVYPTCLNDRIAGIFWSNGTSGETTIYPVPWIEGVECTEGGITAGVCSVLGETVPGTGEHRGLLTMTLITTDGCIYRVTKELRCTECCDGGSCSLAAEVTDTFEVNGANVYNWRFTASVAPAAANCPANCAPALELVVGKGNSAGVGGCPLGFDLDDDGCICNGPDGQQALAGGGGILLADGNQFNVGVKEGCRLCVKWRCWQCVCGCIAQGGWNYIYIDGGGTFTPEGETPCDECATIVDAVEITRVNCGATDETPLGFWPCVYPEGGVETPVGYRYCNDWKLLATGICNDPVTVDVDWGDGTIGSYSLGETVRHCHDIPFGDDPPTVTITFTDNDGCFAEYEYSPLAGV